MRHVTFPYGADPSGQGFFWPQSDQKRSEYFAVKRNSPAQAEAIYQCNPGAKEGSIFLEADFVYYDPPDNLEHGIKDPGVARFCEQGSSIIQAWDTAFSANSDADHSVCFTALLRPCEMFHRDEDQAVFGECEAHFDVDILHIYKDRLDFGDIVKNMRAQYQIWQPSTVIIEKKASGAPAMQSLEYVGLPIEGVTPVEGKRARAVMGLGAGSVQGWFRQGRVRMPSTADWLADYKRELKDFTGEKGGKDDQVDATVHGIQYAIREGGATGLIPTGWSTAERVDAQMRKVEDPLNALWGEDAGMDMFEGCCGRCMHFDLPKSFCKRWQRPTPAIGTCEEFETTENVFSFLRR